jgi:hypothetical protein
MPLTEDVHAAIDRYRRDVVHAADRIDALGTDVAALARRIAAGGPLGTTSDADLTRARQLLDRATDRIRVAAAAVPASAEPCAQYLVRAFPR